MSVKPWDLLRPSMPEAPDDVKEQRLSTCRSCDNYQKITMTCGICHCIMPLKTKMADADCPAGKWGPV